MEGLPLVYAVVVTLVSPVLLSRGRWRLSHPRTALFLWLAAFVTSVLAVLVGLVVFLHVAVLSGADHSPLARTSSFVGAWLMIALLGAVCAVAASELLPIEATRRRVRRQTVDLVAEAATRRGRVGGIPVVVIDTDDPIALCVPGRARQIVVSSRLRNELTAGGFRSVIEHERAHLVQKHDLVTRLAHLLSIALPLVPGSRRLERAAALLLELIADDAAARVCGTDVTADALQSVAQISGDDALMLRASRLRDKSPARTRRPAPRRPMTPLVDLDR